MSISYANGVDPETYAEDGRSIGAGMIIGGLAVDAAGIFIESGAVLDVGYTLILSGLAFRAFSYLDRRRENRNLHEEVETFLSGS